MFNLPAIILPNTIGIFLMALLFINNHKSRSRHLFFDERVFTSMVVLSSFQCAAETLSFLLDGQQFFLARELSLLLNTLLYIGAVLFGYLWVIYIDYKFFSQTHRIRRVYPLMAIPLLLSIVLLIINCFTGIFFTVSADNVYSRSSFVLIFYAIVYAYLLYGVIFAYRQRQYVKKYIFFPALLFLVPVFIGTLCQFLFYGLSLMWAASSIALVSLYINLQNETSYIDPLTGLYNRQYLNHFLADYVRHGSAKKTLGGIMLDVDAFKSINDTFGHCTGDEALKDVGSLLHELIGPHALAARFGGDEFILLLPITDESEVRDLIARIRRACETFNAAHTRPYHLTFSMGWNVLAPNERSAEAFIARMDKDMYATKKKSV